VSAAASGERRRRVPRWLLAAVVLVVVVAVGVALLAGGGGDSKGSSEAGRPDSPPSASSPPKLPPGAVAFVADVPPALGTISRSDLDRVQRSQNETREAALRELIEAIWDRGEAREMGIEGSRYSHRGVLDQAELRRLDDKIQERVGEESPTVSAAAVEEYYEAEKDTKYTHGETRDVRVIVNEDKAQVEAARTELEADSSEAGWKRATKEHSPTTASEAGLQKEIAKEFLAPPLREDIFGAGVGELIGPVKQEQNYLLVEVAKLNPGAVTPLAEVRSGIRRQLTEEARQKKFAEFADSFRRQWRARTVCAPELAIETCSNGPVG
jgi:hypothetical protein